MVFPGAISAADTLLYHFRAFDKIPRLFRRFLPAPLPYYAGSSPFYSSVSPPEQGGVNIANALNTTADELLMDNLENTIKVSNHEFATLLSDCSDYEIRILFDVITATKASIRENEYYTRTRR